MVDPTSLWVLLGLPVLYTLFLWWFSTGAIIYLDGLPRSTFPISMGFATIVVGVACYFLVVTSQQNDVGSAYGAFACALGVWGWVEMAFLMGFVVGPRKQPCPPSTSEWQRALMALSVIFYHELALLAGGLVIAVLTWRAPNLLALMTFAALWISRQSTKLNLFFGVRNFSEQFLPDNLRYIQTYFTRRPMNLLFPVSVSVGSIMAVLLWQNAINAKNDAAAVSESLLATIVALGLLEHWFLILPIDFGAMWKWGMNSRTHSAEAPEASPFDQTHRSEERAAQRIVQMSNCGQ